MLDVLGRGSARHARSPLRRKEVGAVPEDVSRFTRLAEIFIAGHSFLPLPPNLPRSSPDPRNESLNDLDLIPKAYDARVDHPQAHGEGRAILPERVVSVVMI